MQPINRAASKKHQILTTSKNYYQDYAHYAFNSFAEGHTTRLEGALQVAHAHTHAILPSAPTNVPHSNYFFANLKQRLLFTIILY